MVILSNFEPPVENVVLRQENVETHVSEKGNLGRGELFIAHRSGSLIITQCVLTIFPF